MGGEGREEETMDLFDAVSDIRRQHPELDEDEIRSAMDSEVTYEEGRLKGQRKYARAVESAHFRILAWLQEDPSEYRINFFDPNSMAHFVVRHRTACTWAVLKAHAKILTEQ